MKKRYFVSLTVVLGLLVLCSCTLRAGSTAAPTSGGNNNGDISGTPEISPTGQVSPTSTPKPMDDPGSATPTMASPTSTPTEAATPTPTEEPQLTDKPDKPVLQIVVYDDRRADLVLDKETLIDISFDNLEFTFYFPGEDMEMLYEWDVDHYTSILFHKEFNGLGSTTMETAGTKAVYGIDLNPPKEGADYIKEPELNYRKNFSFAKLSGTFKLYYNVPNDFTHVYEYDCAEIIDLTSYKVSEDEPDPHTNEPDYEAWGAALVGTWEWFGYTGGLYEYRCYIFEPGGTYINFGTSFYTGSIEKARQERNEYISKLKYHEYDSYSYDGKTLCRGFAYINMQNNSFMGEGADSVELRMDGDKIYEKKYDGTEDVYIKVK